VNTGAGVGVATSDGARAARLGDDSGGRGQVAPVPNGSLRVQRTGVGEAGAGTDRRAELMWIKRCGDCADDGYGVIDCDGGPGTGRGGAVADRHADWVDVAGRAGRVIVLIQVGQSEGPLTDRQ